MRPRTRPPRVASRLRLAAVRDEVRDDGGIGERRGIAQLVMLVGGDLAQDPAHDLARAGLRQARRPLDVVRLRDRADLLAHPLRELSAQRIGGRLAALQGHVRVNALALDVVREADHRGFGDLRMRNERALDFRGADAMAGDVHDVVYAARDPPVTVLVAARAVAGEVPAAKVREIRVYEALVVAVDGAHLAGPAVEQDEVAFGGALQDLAMAVDERRLDAGQWPRRRARFQLRRTGQRRDQDAAGLGLPPGIHDGAAPVADDAVIPLPGLRVDRLAHGAEQAQALARRRLHRRVALAHQRADRGRRGVKNRDLMLVDDAPEARGVGMVRHALEHEAGRPVRQRPVDDVAVPGDPADVGGAPEDVLLAVVEDAGEGVVHVHQV